MADSGMVPELTLGGQRFMLDRGWDESYENKFDTQTIGFLPHPAAYRWGGGLFRDISIELLIVAGVYKSISTGAEVVDAVEKVFNAALSEYMGEDSFFPAGTEVSIAGWWTRNVLVKSVRVKWEAPWDEDLKPMRATLTIDLTPTYQTQPNVPAEPSELPTKGKFKFDGG